MGVGISDFRRARLDATPVPPHNLSNLMGGSSTGVYLVVAGGGQGALAVEPSHVYLGPAAVVREGVYAGFWVKFMHERGFQAFIRRKRAALPKIPIHLQPPLGLAFV